MLTTPFTLRTMDSLLACPFCREMFAAGEVQTCPTCDIELRPLAELPPSHEAQLLDPFDEEPPEDEVHPWAYTERGRGALIVVAVMGLGFMFAPWVHERAPEIHSLSGFAYAQLLPWLWAVPIAWLTMLGVTVSRRSIRQMRGARVAVGLLAGIVLVTLGVRVAMPPTILQKMVAIDQSWGMGLWANAILGAAALFLATRLGGDLEDMPTRQSRPDGEALH